MSPRLSSRRRHAFTLIEVMVAVTLVSLGLVAVFSGIAALNRAEARAQDAERLQRLAMQTIEQMGPVIDPRTADTSGDYSDQGYNDITWKLDVVPTGVQDVDQITITATHGDDQQALTRLLYVPPTTNSTGTAQ